MLTAVARNMQAINTGKRTVRPKYSSYRNCNNPASGFTKKGRERNTKMFLKTLLLPQRISAQLKWILIKNIAMNSFKFQTDQIFHVVTLFIRHLKSVQLSCSVLIVKLVAATMRFEKFIFILVSLHLPLYPDCCHAMLVSIHITVPDSDGREIGLNPKKEPRKKV